VEDAEVRMPQDKAAWLLELIEAATPARDRRGAGYPSLTDVRAMYPFGGTRGFDALSRSQSWRQARAVGLLLV
jgi:hypothetical protein